MFHPNKTYSKMKTIVVLKKFKIRLSLKKMQNPLKDMVVFQMEQFLRMRWILYLSLRQICICITQIALTLVWMTGLRPKKQTTIFAKTYYLSPKTYFPTITRTFRNCAVISVSSLAGSAKSQLLTILHSTIKGKNTSAKKILLATLIINAENGISFRRSPQTNQFYQINTGMRATPSFYLQYVSH